MFSFVLFSFLCVCFFVLFCVAFFCVVFFCFIFFLVYLCVFVWGIINVLTIVTIGLLLSTQVVKQFRVGERFRAE